MIRSLFALLLLIATPAMADILKTHEKACAAGVQDSCLKGTSLAQRNGNQELMVQFAQHGCALGNNISCSDMGMFHLLGMGVPKDPAKAVPLISSGCRKGYSRACTNLGWMHYTGKGVTRDLSKAAAFYRQGCDGKSGPGCANLAQMMMDGEVANARQSQINRLLRRACRLGHQAAC